MDEPEVWAAPVGAPFPHLHPSRLEGWQKIGTLAPGLARALVDLEADLFPDGTDPDGTVAS